MLRGVPRTLPYARLRTLAEQRVRWGYRRLTVLLRREGFRINHKLVHRLYREEGLAVRRKRRKRTAVARVPLPAPAAANEHWSLDFVSDALADGRKFRCLTLVDQFTRECPVIEVDTSLPGERVVRVLERIIAERGTPRVITIDNGPELAGKALDAWAYRHGVLLDFIQPGKPVENAYIESFNGKFRDECLDQHWFLHLGDARRLIEAYRQDYNEVRPTRVSAISPPLSLRYRTTTAKLLQPLTPDCHNKWHNVGGQVREATASSEIPNGR